MRGFSFFFTKSCPKINFLFFLQETQRAVILDSLLEKGSFILEKLRLEIREVIENSCLQKGHNKGGNQR